MWFVRQDVCLSFYYNFFCHYVQQAGQKSVQTNAMLPWLETFGGLVAPSG